MFHFVANHGKVWRFKPLLMVLPTQIVAVKTMTFWTKNTVTSCKEMSSNIGATSPLTEEREGGGQGRHEPAVAAGAVTTHCWEALGGGMRGVRRVRRRTREDE